MSLIEVPLVFHKRYQRYRLWAEVITMPDVLIRGISEASLSHSDKMAARLGFSRSEYLRQRLERDARSEQAPCTPADFVQFENLSDEQLMRDAWS